MQLIVFLGLCAYIYYLGTLMDAGTIVMDDVGILMIPACVIALIILGLTDNLVVKDKED